MKLTLNLLESDQQIEKKILDCMAEALDEMIIKSIRPIKSRLIQVVSEHIFNCKEIQAIINNLDYRSQVGLINAEFSVKSIIKVWLDNILVTPIKVKRSGARIVGGLRVDMIKEDYQDVLSSPEAQFISENNEVVPWLHWLLIDGTAVLVRNYQITINKRYSRTDLYVMREASNASWKLPSELTGTANDNFVIRALSTIHTDIENIIEQELEKAL